jgi:hypothetical protein
MRRLALLVGFVAMAACGSDSPTAPTPINQNVTLAPGQTATIEGASLSVRFERVSGDSRCPIDAICITGGDALVHIVVSPSAGVRRDYTLHTGDMRPVMHDDFTIALVELTPYPYSARPIQPSEYRATLRVSR